MDGGARRREELRAPALRGPAGSVSLSLSLAYMLCAGPYATLLRSINCRQTGRGAKPLRCKTGERRTSQPKDPPPQAAGA